MDNQAAELLDKVRELLEAPKQIGTDKFIVILPEDRQRIEKAIGRNISTSKELADHVVNALQIRVDDMPIPLTPFLLERLKTRAIRVEWEKFVPMTVKRLLEEYVGLR